MNSVIAWPVAPSDLRIEHGTVHVWAWDFESSKEELDHHMALLSYDEQSRSQRFHFARDRVRYVLSHSILRILLGRYLGLPPVLVAFTKNRYGKPDLAPALATSKIRFNMSHTSRMALLAVAVDLTVGVDVEELRPIEAEIAERYFSERERAALGKLEGAQWLDGFYKCWTRKEAILKAEGIGLNVNLETFEVTSDSEVLADWQGSHTTANLTLNWYLFGLRPGLGFVGALAVSRNPRSVACYHFVGLS